MSDQQFDKFPVHLPAHQTDRDREYLVELNRYFEGAVGTPVDRLRTFQRFVPRSDIGRFLAKAAMFQQVLDVCGYVVECGVFLGGGLLGWGQLSTIFEPLNHVRRVVGFDSFSGFPRVDAKDQTESNPGFARPGGVAAPYYDEVMEAIRIYDISRPIGHIPRIEVVKGNALETMPQYVQDNPHLIVSLLYLDFDIYEPTKKAIETFLPRMPKGAVIAFDELNHKAWPGETLAVLETVGLRNLRLKRFPWQPQLSYAVLE
jgi:Macrocin-O-methyltransferase (TylF)